MGTLESAARVIFAANLKFFSETVTVYKLVSESSSTYDSQRRVVGTAARYDSGTSYTACVRPDSELVQMWSKEDVQGARIREAIRVYLSHDADISANDVVVWNGKRFFVRYNPGQEESYVEVLAQHTEGQEQDGA